MQTAPALAALSIAALVACSGPESAPVSAVSPPPSATPEDLTRPLPDPLPDVVARVNGETISLAQVVPLARAELREVLPPQREAETPRVLRLALQRYIDQELLLQEALSRGVEADTRTVEREYDQSRQEYPDDEEWAEFLGRLGFDPQSFKAALRIRHTVAALIEQEVEIGPIGDDEARDLYEASPAAFAPPGAAVPLPFEAVREEARERVRRQKQDDLATEFVGELRARAEIETFI
jgi:hypothetical protein